MRAGLGISVGQMVLGSPSLLQLCDFGFVA